MNFQRHVTAANALSMCGLTALTINVVWMSVLVYREAKGLAYAKKNIDAGLRRLKSHCRVIGCSVLVIFALGFAVGADMVATCLTSQNGQSQTISVWHTVASR